MNLKRFNRLKFCFTAVLLLYGVCSQTAFAEGEHRHHGSHVHGVATINVALEKNELYIELKSPAANIVGFEHAPRSEKEKSAVKEAEALLKAGENVFRMASGAGAVLKEAVITTGHESDAHHDHEHEKHDADHHGHDHHNHGEDHHDHGEDHHDHDEAHHEEQHSDFKAVYRFHCNHPDKLGYIDVMLFEQFKGIEEIDVQLLTETKQSAMELTPKKNRIVF